jgi:hypothetical protein
VLRIRRDDPERFDLSIADAVNDLVVRPGILRRDDVERDVQQPGNLRAMLGFHEIAAPDQTRHVRVEPRAHRVALAGDAVRARAGFADVAGHQGEIDDRLRGTRALVALIHAHRPPERNRLAAMDAFRAAIDFADGQTGF